MWLHEVYGLLDWLLQPLNLDLTQVPEITVGCPYQKVTEL
jgi:hypothetical protein